MVITVSCPTCSASFPVDSAKVPAKGVNARCSSCGTVFRIEKPAEEPAVAAADLAPDPVAPPAPAPPPPPPAPEPPAPEPEPVAEVPEPLPPPTVPAAVAEAPRLDDLAVVPPPAPPVAAPPSEPATPAPGSTPPGGTFRFGKRDPTDKAKRLARVLVSDMIMYNADRHRSALENGTLAEDFEDEIEKSWKEYVEQIGAEIAEGDGKGFWRDALNDILAKGESIF